MAKEFKTIDELISLLESRGVKTDSATAPALERESYYAIINGYKTPFLDLEAMKKSPEDVFKKGVEFEWMYDLFMFDRDLRSLTFEYLARAEAIIKTSVVYSFCNNHREESAYLDVSNFCAPNEVLVSRNFKGNKKKYYGQNISLLMSILNKKLIIKYDTRPFIKHYILTHGNVPLWVLSNCLTFGNISHFYQLMQRKDQNDTCRSIAKVCGRNTKDSKALTPRDLLRANKILVDFRNVCAHDERLYCAKSGNDDFAVMTTMLRRVLPNREVDDLLVGINDLFRQYAGRLHHVTPETLIKDMGFRIERDN